MGIRELKDLLFIQTAILMQFAHGPFRGKIVFGCRSKFGVDHPGDIGDHGLNLTTHLGAFLLQFSFYLVGCLRNQLLKEWPGNVSAQTEMLSKDAVILGASYKM